MRMGYLQAIETPRGVALLVGRDNVGKVLVVFAGRPPVHKWYGWCERHGVYEGEGCNECTSPPSPNLTPSPFPTREGVQEGVKSGGCDE